MKKPSGMESVPLRTFIFNSIKPFKTRIFVQMAIMSYWAFDLNVRPYILKLMIDAIQSCISTQQALNNVIPIGALYIGLSLFGVLLLTFYNYNWRAIIPPLRKKNIKYLTKKMLEHSQSVFNMHLAGALAHKINDAAKGICDFLRVTINNLYSYTLVILFALVPLLSIHPLCALLMLSWVTIFLLGTTKLSHQAKECNAKAAELHTSVIGRIVDVFSNNMNVRLFCSALFESKKLTRLLHTTIEADQKKEWQTVKIYAFQGISFVLYQTACISWLLYGLYHNMLTIGDFVMVLTINSSIADCLWSISDDLSKANDALGVIWQGLSIVLTPLSIKDQHKAPALHVTEGKIQFDGVSFYYKKATPLFQNKTITIHPQQKVGLVGYSGSGKSTFISLILRLYDVTKGRILVDGQDIKKVTQHSLHQAISIIPQDPSLFHRSIFENIKYGNPQATYEQVIEAAKKAHAHDFIMKLTKKYQTIAGERGISLSGGQRQRIIIARALLKQSRIFILDEATSQMDSITEAGLQENLLAMMEGKTSLVIAHRLSTLLKMDRILVFERGKIVQDGPHSELIKVEGLYKTLWENQTNGMLPEQIISSVPVMSEQVIL